MGSRFSFEISSPRILAAIFVYAAPSILYPTPRSSFLIRIVMAQSSFCRGRGTVGLGSRTYVQGRSGGRRLDIMDKLFFIQHFLSKNPLGKPDRHPTYASLSDGQLAVTSRGAAARRVEDDVDWGRMRGLPRKGGETV
jgi:hypothetical protein